MIPEEYQDLDDDLEVCAEDVGDLLAEYGDIVHEFVSNFLSSQEVDMIWLFKINIGLKAT